MSDVTMFPQHVALEHHILEVVAFQWDGTKDHALTVAGELEAECKMRDARLVSAHYRLSTKDRPVFTLTIERQSDGQRWDTHLAEGMWCAAWLHQQRVYMVTRMEAAEGEVFFRRVSPVVRIGERRPTLGQ